MINTIYSIARSALQNAQVSLANVSSNIANADTEGYQRTTTNYSTNSSITIYGLSVGTGASVTSITAEWDSYVEAQYLDSSAELNRQNAALKYADQLDSLWDQDEDSGLAVTLNAFWNAWNDLITDPTSSSAREALLGAAETLAYSLSEAAEELETMTQTIDTEIAANVDDANDLIDSIAKANASIAANPDDTTAISERDQMIRDLNEIIGVDVLEQEDGTVTILTEEGYTLVDGSSTHHLAYAEARSTESLLRDSSYEGSLRFSGSSSEEILIEFVSAGADGAAQYKVSLDGGATWLTDGNGDTMLYTADGEDNAVTIEGVTIWFDGSAGEHAVGDRYTVVAKSGLYWEGGDGSLVNITPMTGAGGDEVSGRTTGGTLAGLFLVRDDVVVPTLDSLNDLTETLIWEVNSLHSQGAGLEADTSMVGTYSVDDSGAALSNCGLAYGDRIVSGSLELVLYDADGAVTTTALIDIEPSDSLQDVVDAINSNAALGGGLTASINADGRLVLDAADGTTFEIVSDSSNILAALGLNTFFDGSDADTIAVRDSIAADTSGINAGALGDDYLLASGNNEVAAGIVALADSEVRIGSGSSAAASSLGDYLAAMVSTIGSAASAYETEAETASVCAEYYYNQQASTAEVNVDEELVDLTRYQQAYQAAAKMIEVSKEMMQTVLDMI
jgi:flagellar hook-associated protein 1 FlgK